MESRVNGFSVKIVLGSSGICAVGTLGDAVTKADASGSMRVASLIFTVILQEQNEEAKIPSPT